MADAAYVMLARDSASYTGNFAVDEDILRQEGIRDFEQYAVKPGGNFAACAINPFIVLPTSGPSVLPMQICCHD